jgi:WS/DGAT/MGAT family acyltransferase
MMCPVHRADTAIQRATADDLVLLATDVGPAPMQVGAVLRLARLLDQSVAVEEIGRRIVAVPRLRQRFEDVPLGCGRPIWVDDPGFSVGNHVEAIDLGGTGDETALLDVVAQVIGAPLVRSRPLWRMALVVGLVDGGSALVVAFHHLLSDGIGGLAMLASLVDGADAPADPGWPRSRPTARRLARDAWAARVAAVGRTVPASRRLRAALGQLRPAGGPAAAPRCSLNTPTGAERGAAVVRTPLDEVRAAAHRHGATVNDVVLTAAVGALGALLARRGEQVERLVVSVPVSGRETAVGGELGNQVGAVPVELPVVGSPAARLRATAAATGRAKQGWRGASNAVLGPVFRVLAALRLFRPFVERQHLVNTFVTNLRGPDVRLSLLGAEITEVAAVTIVPGNVSVCFAALSYAGTLAVTVVADPQRCEELGWLRDELERQLGSLARTTTGSPDVA